MIWQDIVVGGVSFMFLIGIMTQIYKCMTTKDTKAFSWTMVVSTMLGMIGLTISMFSLGLMFSGAMNFGQFIAWATLLILKMKFD